MDVWGPARVQGQGRERYFLLVVDDYSRYTTVFPLRSKGEVTAVLIPWIRVVRLHLRKRFRTDLPVLRLHSDRGGEFSSDLLRSFCEEEGIHQSFTLPASLQQNGIAERRIGLVMELNLWPRVSLPKTSPSLRWTGEVDDASAFRVWGSRVFVRESTAGKLSSRAVPCVFLGFPPDAPGWQFYHPTSRRVFPSQDVTFDESVPFYRLFPYHTAPLPPPPPPPLFLAPVPLPVDPLPPQGPAPSSVSQVDPLPLAEPVEVTGDPDAEPGGAACGGSEPVGAEPGGAASGGAEPAGAASGGAKPRGAASGGTEPGGAEPGGVEPRGAWSTGASLQRSPQREPFPPQQLREWLAQRTRLRRSAIGAGSTGAGGAGAGGASGAGAGDAGAGGTGARGAGAAGTVAGGTGAGGTGARATDAGGPGAGGTCVGGTGVGDTGAGGAGAGGTGAGGAGAGGAGAGGTGAGGARAGDARARGTGARGTRAGGSVQQRPFFLPSPQLSELPPESVLRQVLSLPSSTALPPDSPLPATLPYTEQPESLTERREPESRPASPVRTVRRARRVPRPRPPPVPGTHTMALRPSSAPQRVPLSSPPASSLPDVPDPESDAIHAAHPTVTRLLATVVTDPSFESAAASALSVCPPSVGGECALGTDVLEDRQEDFDSLAAAVPHLVAWLLAPEGDPDALDIPTPRTYAEAISGPYSSQWQTAMDAEMASWKSTGTYVDEVPPPGANIVDGMWIFRVKRPPGSPPVFKARYVARGFSQRQGVDFFQTFSPTPKMTTLRVLLHVAAQRDYELHSLDFSTAFLQGSLHEEIWLRRPPGFTGSFPPGTQWSLRRPVYGLRQAPREWHDTLRTTLAALGFAPSTADPSLFLRTDTSLPPRAHSPPTDGGQTDADAGSATRLAA
ncbi:unnamed protein product [Closterium sp. Yama58-4]|nr:unnamed protein product [Closterium sp. Yama58-4]